MAHQAAARVADVSGGGKVEEAETRASAVAEQAVSAACPLCGAAPLELYTKSGTQFRDHYRCSKHSSGPCPYKETVVALAVRACACVCVRARVCAHARVCALSRHV